MTIAIADCFTGDSDYLGRLARAIGNRQLAIGNHRVSNQHEYLAIRSLRVEDSAALSLLLRSQPPNYARFFYAFSFEEDVISKLLSERQRDFYAGVFWQGELAGFFMLLGWRRSRLPSFGVLSDEKHRGGAFMRLHWKREAI